MEKIVIMVLITLTMGQAKEDLDTMKEMMAEMKMEMMAEMNERLSLAEGKLAKTEDELTATKDDLAITKEDLDTMKKMRAEMKMEMNERLVRTGAELAITKDTLMSNIEELDTMKEMKTEMMAEMEMKMNERLVRTEAELAITKDELAFTKNELALTKARTDELEREVAIVRAPPYIHSCGSHDATLSGSSMTIPYTSLLYSSTNTEGGGLDISTGVFTAPHGGSYTVYWDTSAELDSGEDVKIYLQKNGEIIEESEHYSSYTGPSGWVYDQGGRTIIVYLGEGDTLQLYRSASSGQIWRTTFCVSLTTPDIV